VSQLEAGGAWLRAIVSVAPWVQGRTDFRAAADAILVLHLCFLLFVSLGGLAVLRWPRLAWVHVPAAAWGILIEYAGWI